jgi:hypothetical protein
MSYYTINTINKENQADLLYNCVEKLPTDVLQKIACFYRRRVEPRKRYVLPDLIIQTPSISSYIKHVPNAFSILSLDPESIRYETCPKYTFDLEGLKYYILYYPKPSLFMLTLGIEDLSITADSQHYIVSVFLNKENKEENVLQTTIDKDDLILRCYLPPKKEIFHRLNIPSSHISYWMTATAIIFRRNGWDIDGSSRTILYNSVYNTFSTLRDAIHKGIDAYPQPLPPSPPAPTPRSPSKCSCVLQ